MNITFSVFIYFNDKQLLYFIFYLKYIYICYSLENILTMLK